jgi:hypothetical protein
MLGFIVVEKTPKADGFVSALMVTDDKGYPLEFRATTPIRPTLVQKTLYGKQMEHYVGVELCGKTLIGQSSRKPTVFLVPNEKLLEIASHSNINVVAIWRAGESIKVQEKEDVENRGAFRAADSDQPLVYEGRFLQTADRKDILPFLQSCADRFALVEAFDRMRTALQLLAKEDKRYA